jgi:hypothetical protein
MMKMEKIDYRGLAGPDASEIAEPGIPAALLQPGKPAAKRIQHHHYQYPD